MNMLNEMNTPWGIFTLSRILVAAIVQKNSVYNKLLLIKPFAIHQVRIYFYSRPNNLFLYVIY